jgi:hypothetical protein
MLKAVLLIALLGSSVTVSAATDDNSANLKPSGAIGLGRSLYEDPPPIRSASAPTAEAPRVLASDVQPVPASTVVAPPTSVAPRMPTVEEAFPSSQAQAVERTAVSPEPDEYLHWGQGRGIKTSDAIIGFSTVVLAIFTGLLWWSTLKLWKETKAGGKTAEISARAAEESARAALVSADVAFAAEQPRWAVKTMHLGVTSVDEANGTRACAIAVTLKNHGRTAAEVTRTVLAYKLAPLLDEEPRYPIMAIENAEAFGDVVDPGGTRLLTRKALRLTGDEMTALVTGTTRLWAYGTLSYRDSRDQHWTKGFIGVLDARSMVWTIDELGQNFGGPFSQPLADARVQSYVFTKPDVIGEPVAGPA